MSAETVTEQKNSSELNSSNLQGLAKANPTAEAIFLYFASRSRNTASINLQSLKMQLLRDGVKVVDADFYSTFKELEKMGVGSIILATKGSATGNTFELHYSLIDVGILASDSEAVKTRLAAEPVAPSPAAKPVFDRSAAMKARWAAGQMKGRPKATKPVAKDESEVNKRSLAAKRRWAKYHRENKVSSGRRGRKPSRSTIMKRAWAKRKNKRGPGRPKLAKSNNSNVQLLKLINKLAKQLAKAA